MVRQYLSGYNPFDGKPDEDPHKQAWYFTKIGAIFSGYYSINAIFNQSLRGKKPIELLGMLLKTNWPTVAIAYGGVAATALIYNARGPDNWRSTVSPYFLGFLSVSALTLTKSTGRSYPAFWKGVGVATGVVAIGHCRVRGIRPDFAWYSLHLRDNSSDQFGRFGQKDLNITNTKEWVDPGRKPMF